MSEQDNLNTVRKEFEGFNTHNANLTVQYMTDNVRVIDPTYPEPLTKEQLRKSNEGFIAGFPDLHFDLKNIIAQGDQVAATWVVHGTHKAPLMLLNGDTIPPTQKTITVPGVTYYQLRDGQILVEEIYYDQVSFLTQIGILDPQELAERIRR